MAILTVQIDGQASKRQEMANVLAVVWAKFGAREDVSHHAEIDGDRFQASRIGLMSEKDNQSEVFNRTVKSVLEIVKPHYTGYSSVDLNGDFALHLESAN